MNILQRLTHIATVVLTILFFYGTDLRAERNLFRTTLSGLDLENKLLNRDQFRPIPGIEDRETWENKLPKHIREFAVEESELKLGEPWKALPARLILEYFEHGDRTIFESKMYARHTRLWLLLLAEISENEGRFLADIVDGIWAICEDSSWVIPAHMDQWWDVPNLPNVNDPYVDTIVAEVSSLLSWIVYFLGDQLDSISPLIRERIQTEVSERMLKPVMVNEYWWMGFDPERTRPNNWNPWITSNWLTALFILEEDTEKRIEGLQRIARVLDMFTNPFPADGGSDEGPMYWGAAAGALFDNIGLLHAATNGGFDIYAEPLIYNMAVFPTQVYIGEMQFYNYSDTGRHANLFHGALAYRFGQAVGSEALMGLGAHLWQNLEYTPFRSWTAWRRLNDFLVHDEILAYPAREPMPLDSWLPDIEVMTARSIEDSHEGFYLAAKGGHNDESHNHNDVGSFIVYHDGNPVLIDVGIGTYTRRKFGPRRYSVWSNRSEFHNLPTINGVQQQPGEQFRSSSVNYEAEENRAKFQLDIAGAYAPAAGVEQWLRSIELVRSQKVVVEDSYKLKRGEELRFNLMTRLTPEKGAPGVVLLRSNNDNRNYRIEYSPGTMVPVFERLPLDQPEDPRIIQSWGEQIFRIVLKRENPELKGTVRIVVTKND